MVYLLTFVKNDNNADKIGLRLKSLVKNSNTHNLNNLSIPRGLLLLLN